MDKDWKKLIEVQEDNQKFIIRWELLEEKAREEKTQPQKTQNSSSESTLKFPVKEDCYKAMKIKDGEEDCYKAIETKDEETTKDGDEGVLFKREKWKL
ncbi:unnamed protein product [Arabis nemorensis]|uniref:Uncharacterized protein n=1 Tax=Arabis nemorensis TaxID=586526 RepID=A0A565CUL7_9BRAS|nr:unnamed protein product [Arabis nemorensis]